MGREIGCGLASVRKGSCFFEAGGIIFGLGTTPGRGPSTAVTRARATTRADEDMAQTDARYATRYAVTHGEA